MQSEQVDTRSIGFMAVKSAARLLLVDDDEDLCELLSDWLREDGYTVDVAHSPDAVTGLIERGEVPDLVLLDWRLGDFDGLGVLRGLRMTQGLSALPILMLSAVRIEPAERAMALEAGADDFVVKPPSYRPEHRLELLARVRALLRRSRPVMVGGAAAGSALNEVIDSDSQDIYLIGRMTLSISMRELTDEGKPIRLTDSQFNLIHELARAWPDPVPRDELIPLVFPRRSNGPSDKAIESLVVKLRRNLPEDMKASLIRAVRYRGYRIGPTVKRVEGR